jgi:hypothetical protein
MPYDAELKVASVWERRGPDASRSIEQWPQLLRSERGAEQFGERCLIPQGRHVFIRVNVAKLSKCRD